MPKYKTEFQQYNTSQEVQSNCNVITFVNNAGSAITVNNYPLAASGGTLQIAGNAGEIDTTTYKVNCGTTAGNWWVIKKIDI